MILAEYPRSGGTWTSFLLSYCLNVPMIDLDSDTPKPADPLRRELVLGKWQHQKFHQVHRIAKTHKILESIKLLPSEKKILLVRDGRDTLTSYYFYQNSFKARKKKVQKNIVNFLFSYGDTDFSDFVRVNAIRWKEYILSYIENVDYILKYEDLNSNGSLALEKLFQSLELDVSQDVIAYAVDLFKFENFSGGRSKGQESSSSFFRKGGSGDWKEKFDEKSRIAWKDSGANEMLLRLGYDD
jgi:hypothetical protein